MRSSSKSLDPAVRKLMADAAAAAHDPSAAQRDPALLKALAEASAWIVTLHGPDRTPAVDRGFQRWLAESPMHQYAFEHATNTWNKTRATVRRSARVDVSAPAHVAERPVSGRRAAIFAIAASLIVAAIGAFVFVQHLGIRTGVGERRTVVLEDGTQVTLNTATQMFVHYEEDRRCVRLESGEAFFEVAKDPRRPFVVTAGSHQVTALGTTFLVRRDAARISVTLVEGKVAVRSADEQTAAAGSAEAASVEEAAAGAPSVRTGSSVMKPSKSTAGAAHVLTLEPGQRVVFEEDDVGAVLDQPALEKLTAWQHGLVNIEDLTLAQAVAEMNRYSTLQLVVEGPAADIRMSGVFRVTDSENLARAVAMTHGLTLRKEDRRIVLSGIPQPPNVSRFDRSTREHDATF